MCNVCPTGIDITGLNWNALIALPIDECDVIMEV
jgi:hypothetical protein